MANRRRAWFDSSFSSIADFAENSNRWLTPVRIYDQQARAYDNLAMIEVE